jgi:FHA domain-containing protein/double zinc ribbon protein
MTAICPFGHKSQTSDFCDRCGSRIDNFILDLDAHMNGASDPQSAVMSPDAVSLVPTKACPNCRSVNAEDDSFCESCGYHFSAGTAPPAPAVPPPTEVWEATVVADRPYYDRLKAGDIQFPAVCPDRRFTLSGDRLLIGRRSASRGINPEIDLSGAPEDVAVSHTHAVLVRDTDGGWAIIDPGSANGTFVNDSTDPIPTNEAVVLKEGDQVHIGAWTTLTLRKKTSGRVVAFHQRARSEQR